MPLIARVMRQADVAVRRARPHRRHHRPRQLHRPARRHLRGARHRARGRQAGGRPDDARGLCRAAISPPTTRPRSPSRSTRGTSTSICRCSAPAGARSSRRASPAVADAVRAAAHRRRSGSSAPAPTMLAAAWPARELPPALVDDRRAPDIVWVARLAVAADESASAAEAALSARARRAAAGRRAAAAPMIGIARAAVRARRAGALGGGPRDAAAIAALHAASFRRGWSDDEFERLLVERNVVAHRATAGRALHGFILSRLAADEAEILSIAVASRAPRPRARARAARSASAAAGRARRARGVPRGRRGQRAGAAALPAGRLPRGRRGGRATTRKRRRQPATALVLRRDLV